VSKSRQGKAGRLRRAGRRILDGALEFISNVILDGILRLGGVLLRVLGRALDSLLDGIG
jgi:hypothetical protein